MRKRLLAIVATVALVVAMVPATTFAVAALPAADSSGVITLIGDVTVDEGVIDDDIYSTPAPSLGNLNTPKQQPSQQITSNTGIIQKALGKASKPIVNAGILWENFPKKQIEMLNEIMEIDTKEIVEWYAAQLDTTEIAIAIHNSIVSYINDQLYGKVIDINDVDITLESEKHINREPINSVAKESVMFVDETPVKSPKKSSPKKTTKKTKK